MSTPDEPNDVAFDRIADALDGVYDDSRHNTDRFAERVMFRISEEADLQPDTLRHDERPWAHEPMEAPEDSPTAALLHRLNLSAERRASIYESQLDRLAMVAVGTLAALGSVAAILIDHASSRLPTVLMFVTLSMVALFLALQSGRTGFLARSIRNDIADVGASMGVSVVKGHRRIHSAENLAICRSSKLILVEPWLQERTCHETAEFSEAYLNLRERLVNDQVEAKIAVAAREGNWSTVRNLLEGRVDLDRASQRFYVENPLVGNVLASENEIILSFPGPTSNDRAIAVRITDPAVVMDLYDAFEKHVWRETEADFVQIRSRSDLEIIDTLVAPEVSDEESTDDQSRGRHSG